MKLTEQQIAERAFAPGAPGFVGAAIDLLLARPGLPGPALAALGLRPALRHGFLTARSARVAVVSGPPSPGLETCLARMAEDLPSAVSILAGHGADPNGTHSGRTAAGIRLGLEAGLDGGGPLGLVHRWRLAHTLAPVLAAAFANSPAGGWRSGRQAGRREMPVVPPGRDPRAAWTGWLLGAERFGDRVRAGEASAADLDRHVESLRLPVVARGHLELDVIDRQPGDGWRVAIAVAVALLDDARAAEQAAAATDRLAGEPRLWERAARDALTDPVLAEAARDCFLTAYAALARQGTARGLRDEVAEFTERYVLRGRCPADDAIDRTAAGR